MKVKDICSLQNGRAFKPDDWGAEGLPIIRIQNLNDEEAPFNYYAGEYNPVHEVNDGELLFSWSGTPGTSFGAFRWYRGKGVLNQHIFRVIPKTNIDKEYLKYALNGNITTIISKAHGGVGLQHITKKELDEIEITVVSEQKQKDIVAVLHRVEKVITLRKKELKELDDLIKARFVEMFGNDDYPSIPLIETIIPGAGLSYGIVVPGDNVDDGIPMVRPSDFKNGTLDLSNVYRVGKEIESKYSRTRLVGDEILVQVIGQPGQVMLATSECKGMNVTRNLAVIRPNLEKINRTYLKYFIEKEDSQHFLLKNTKQSTLKQLPLNLLKQLEVQLPPMVMQNRFADFVKQVDKSKAVIQKSLDETQLLFDSLMQKYFG